MNKQSIMILVNLGKAIKIMKIIVVMLLGFIPSAMATSYAQNAKLSISVQNESLNNVFREIEKQSDFLFFYQSDEINRTEKISIEKKNSTIYEVLDEIAQKTNIDYTVRDRHIVLTVHKEEIAGNNTLGATLSTQQAVNGKKVTGIILDEFGEPVIGASILLVGTLNGVITDIDGNFSIEAPANGVLKISYIGYTTQEFPVGNETYFRVILKEDEKVLDEIVVVGYGVQKKVNMTGAVSAVKVDEKLSGRSVSNVSSGLSGLVPGLSVMQSSGFAGSDEAALQIRGLGSLNNASPLVVVDGMPDVDINRINMNDIESISVLKDAASSAVYGSRAANGVILITTKTGKDESKAKLNYSGSFGVSKATSFYDYLDDYPRAMAMQIRAARAGNSSTGFREASIEQWMSMGLVDPILFPNTDQYDDMFRTGQIQTHNISASGSSGNANFFLSIGVMDQKGLQRRNDHDRYNVRLNIDYKIRDNITVGMRTDGQWTETMQPRGAGLEAAGMQYAISGILNKHPETGQYGGAMAYGENNSAGNMLAEYDLYTTNRTRQEYNSSIYGEWQVIDGLKINVSYGLRYFNAFNKIYQNPDYQWNFQTGERGRKMPDNDRLTNQNYNGHKTLFQGRINYDKEIFEGHQLALMFNAAEEYWFDRGLTAYRQDRFDSALTELDGASSKLQANTGNTSSEGLRSYIGRLNYTLFDKYLLEANFRYDGSSKFTKGHQWGFFPSVAVGWRISEEPFFEKLKEVAPNVKVRASIGSLGNNAGVWRYEQKDVFTNISYVTGDNNVVSGFAASKMINRDFSWEKTVITNLGLDLGFFNNKLTAEIDYYDRLTTDMIVPADQSRILSGYTAPRKNMGDLRNRGVELNLGWRSSIQDFNYSVNFNVSFNKNNLEKWDQVLQRGWKFLDMPYEFVYSYVDAGLVQSWNDIYNASYQNSYYTSPGDVLIKDMNGDGQITDADKKAYSDRGRNNTTGQYGLNLSAGYKGFDLSALFQAATGRWDFWLDALNNVTVPADRYGFQKFHWQDTWSLDNRNASMPRLTTGENGGKNREESTYWLQDASYLRMKSLQLGYSLPKAWLNKLTLDNVRIYLTAENLFTLSKWKGIDPEKTKSYRNNADNFNSYADRDPYPLVKTYSVGLNIAF